MGYTHYWKVPSSIDRSVFKHIVEDFQKTLPVLEELGIQIAGPSGEGEPLINLDSIEFNGIHNCGHQKRNFGIAWPEEDAHGVSLVYAINDDEGTDVKGQWFAGRTILARSCDGDCSHESFHLFRQAQDLSEPTISGFCKTAFKPYDLAVQVCLVIAWHHLGNKIDISSVGKFPQWKDSMNVCQTILGYGDNFWELTSA